MIYFRRIPKSTKIILLYAHVFIFSFVLFIYKRHQTLYSEDGYLDLDHRNKLAVMQSYVQLDREQFNTTFNPHIYKGMNALLHALFWTSFTTPFHMRL